MHASVVLPCRINFTIFECFLKGYDVSETAEYLVHQNALRREMEATPFSLSPSSQPPVRDAVNDNEDHRLSNLRVAIPSSDGNAAFGMETFSPHNVPSVLLGYESKNEIPRSFDASSFRVDLIKEEVEEDYRNFRNFVSQDNCLRTPYAFLTTHCVLLPYADRIKMVNMYYEYEPAIFRFFIGHKFARSPVETMLQDLRNSSSKTFHGGSSDFLQKLCSDVNQIDDNVVKRQLENVKRVCSTITRMYHRKGEQYIPNDVPLQIAVEKCFGLQRPLSLHYTVAVFSYEHNLTTKFLERFKTCEDCFAACSLLAAYGCDHSGLFVGDVKSIHLKTVSRQLEDARILGDLHMEMFGEPFKPRWQQQLDGSMQRVIGSSNMALASEKVQTGAAGSGEMSSSVSSACGPGNITSGGSHDPVGMSAGNTGGGNNSGIGILPTTAGNYDGCSNGSPNGVSRLSSVSGFPWHSPTGSGVPHPFMCANSRFTKRFCFAFGLLMKALSKITFLLSTGHFNDALDCFASRVLHLLEQLGARDSPAGEGVIGGSSPAGFLAHPISSFPSSPGTTLAEEHDHGGIRGNRRIVQKLSESFLHGPMDRIDSPLRDKSTPVMASGVGAGGTDTAVLLPSFSYGGEAKSENLQNSSITPVSMSTPFVGKGLAAPNTGTKDKVYVIELCGFLGMLPQVWNHITPSCDPEERETFLSVAQLLKALASLIISLEGP